MKVPDTQHTGSRAHEGVGTPADGMTAAERLGRAISGAVPDRVPVVPKIYVDLAAILTGRALTEIVQEPVQALRALVEAGRTYRVDAVRQFHLPQRRTREVDEQVFEIDAEDNVIGRIDLLGGLVTRLEDPSFFNLRDERQVAFNHFWSSTMPLIPDLEAAERLAIPPKEFYEEYGCGERQRAIQEEVGFGMGLIGDCHTATMAFLVEVRGMEQAMLDLIEAPELVHVVMEKGVKIAAERGKFNLDLGLRVLRINDSVGNMSVISPAHWREFVYPHLKDLCSELHRYEPTAKLYCHICGNVLPIVDDLVDAGLDCIAPLDPLGGFTPAEVRARVGDAVSLMGGVNTLTFVHGTPDQIIDESKRCMAEAGKGGGFVLGSGCVVPRDSRRENLEALSHAAERYGYYSATTGKLTMGA